MTEKIKQGKTLTDEDIMQYSILPLTYPWVEQKSNSIKELFELIKEIKEEETQLFLLSGILVFTDKVIDEEISKNWLSDLNADGLKLRDFTQKKMEDYKINGTFNPEICLENRL